MAGGTYSKVKSVVAGETILALDRNSEHDNHITNNSPAGIGGNSDDLATMQLTVDPFPAGVPSLASDMKGELERIRFQLNQLIGGTNWYEDPSGGGGANFLSGKYLFAAIVPLTGAATNTLAFASAEDDADGWFGAPNDLFITCQTAGKYMVYANLIFNSAVNTVDINLNKNGSNVGGQRFNDFRTSLSVNVTFPIFAYMDLIIGDQVSVDVILSANASAVDLDSRLFFHKIG